MNWLRREGAGHYLNEAGLTGAGVLVGAVPGRLARALSAAWRGRELLLVEPGPDAEVARDPRARPADRDSVPDGGLDFAYLGETAEVAAAMRAWAAKVRPGGLLAGTGYAGAVKDAVDAFGLGLGVAPAFTAADPDTPDWFFRVPAGAPPPPERIALVTGYDAGYAAVGELSRPNKEAYCRRHGYAFVCRTDGFDPDRPASWSKVRFVREALGSAEWVYWGDADSLVMDSSVPLSRFCWDSADLVLSGDPYNGINLGCFLARATDWTRGFLARVDATAEFALHPWWENAAVLSLYASEPGVRRRVAVLPNALFNAYPYPGGGYEPGRFVAHFPGLAEAERLSAMRRFLDLAR